MNASNSILTLFQPEEIRRKAHDFLERAVDGELSHVDVDLSEMDRVLLKVLEVTKGNYPDFQIPPHGVWRDFEAGDFDRWGALASARGFESAEEMLVAAADLAVIANYMKTRHPENWVFEDRMTATQAEGMQASALAAFHMFASGSFSSDMSDPYRVDAETLIRMDLGELADALQWNLQRDAGMLEDMQRHLKRLGEALALRPDLFSEGDVTRPGLLATRLAKQSSSAVDAGIALDRLLESLAPVWDGGAVSGEIALGDCFAHSQFPGSDLEQLFPFHLTAQEIVYSLVEPFAWAGWEVSGLEVLSAPADLPHVALFSQAGVLNARRREEKLSGSEALDCMIELRAISMALTDKLADMLCAKLQVTPDQLPLSCVLEGGTSRAGAQILQQNETEAKKLGQLLNPGSVFWLPFGA
jgi:Protein of unknown function (DUF1688)